MTLVKRPSFSPWIYDLIVIAFLFLLALTIRIQYQSETVVDHPIRADSRAYFFGAYNLYHFGVFSTEPPQSTTTAPPPNSDRVPGYSLFLSLFMGVNKPVKQFLDQVKTTQALLGALVTVMSYLLARFCFSLFPAFAVGFLTAVSPHLISMDNYLLSESLFTFVILAGTLVFTISWKKEKLLLSFLGGALFGFSSLIRPVALLLGPFIALIYILDKRDLKLRPARVIIKLYLFFLFGVSLIYAPYLTHSKINHVETSDVGGLLGNIVFGSYINLTHKNPALYGFPYRDDPECRKMIKDRKYFLTVFKKRFQSDPWSYIKWYAGGKILCSWRWNIASGMGDVFIYPVTRSGFHSGDNYLKAIHRIMKWLHWPLVILAFINPFFLVLNLRRKTPIEKGSFYSLPSIFMILYHAVILTILFPLPRYTIPLRPYLYLLAIGSLVYLFQWAFHPFYKKGLSNL